MTVLINLSDHLAVCFGIRVLNESMSYRVEIFDSAVEAAKLRAALQDSHPDDYFVVIPLRESGLEDLRVSGEDFPPNQVEAINRFIDAARTAIQARRERFAFKEIPPDLVTLNFAELRKNYPQVEGELTDRAIFKDGEFFGLVATDELAAGYVETFLEAWENRSIHMLTAEF